MILPMYRKIFLVSLISGLIISLLLFLFLPNKAYAYGFLVGDLTGMLDFLLIIIYGTLITKDSENLNKAKFSKGFFLANRSFRMLIIIGIIVTAFVFPTFLNYITLLLGIVMIKCIVAIVAYKYKNR